MTIKKIDWKMVEKEDPKRKKWGKKKTLKEKKND